MLFLAVVIKLVLTGYDAEEALSSLTGPYYACAVICSKLDAETAMCLEPHCALQVMTPKPLHL